MIIELNEKMIELTIIRKPNKNIYMRFNSSNNLVITCNNFVTQKDILKIIEKNKKSLIKMLHQKEKEEQKNLFFQYLGKQYTKIFDGISKEVSFNGDSVISKDEKNLAKFYKNECLRLFQSEIYRITPYFENIPKFSLKIRYMKTRWGVNNITNKVITLNSELLKKDLDLIDYVIIHELCHFYEANHSKAFWDHVAYYYPHYKEARKRLKE